MSIAAAAPWEVFEVSFDATPLDAATEGVVALQQGTALAAAVRFTRSGTIERSGTRPFAPEGAVPYAAGQRYRFRLVVRPGTRSYDAFVAAAGSAEQTLGTRLPLRAAAGRQIDAVAAVAISGRFELCGVAVAEIEPALRAVWAAGDGEKVARDDLQNPAKLSSAVWDGRTARLAAARNELVAFQIVVEAGSRGIRGLELALPELRRRGGAERILHAPPADDPTRYAGRPIQIFSENYMNVARATQASWIYRQNTPSAPLQPTGWKPVQLVPPNARAGRGGFPLEVAPNQNQAFWIDVYTARDLPAGIYEGMATVRADDERRDVAVELEVLDFRLPDRNSLHAMVYYERSQPVLYQGRNLDPEYHRFAHRQRIELVNAYTVASARAAVGRFDGADFTAERGYEGPGEGVGNTIVPATFYGPGTAFDERASAWSTSDAWITFVEGELPGARTFVYMPDEPPVSEYARIWRIADNIHSNPGPGRRLPVFVTKRYDAALDGAIDVWCSPPSGYDIARALDERSRGRDYWVYNGGRPAGPAIVIDSPATDPRVVPWACFKHGIEVYFYWHGVHWRHNSQKREGDRNQDVWVNPITYDNGQSFANGDGVLIYPGEEVLHPDGDRGIAGPIGTVQLANLRRGLQDHQYLTLARKLGLDAEVDEALAAIVPRMFSDAGTTVGFAEKGDAFEEARRKLGRAIARASAR